MYIFSPKAEFPVFKKTHKAAVKAIEWSNYKVGYFATGGGTADRWIRIWSLNQKEQILEKDSESQVCNLFFSKRDDNLVSSHGFSNNEINIWDSKTLEK